MKLENVEARVKLLVQVTSLIALGIED